MVHMCTQLRGIREERIEWRLLERETHKERREREGERERERERGINTWGRQ